MKLLKFTLAAFLTVKAQYNPTTNPTTVPTTVPFNGLSCFHCDAANMTHCEEIGEVKPCQDNAQSCMIELRKREGEVESVCMGCKSRRACSDNMKQNFKGKWADRQCKPWAWYTKGPSVCRQCCNTDDSCADDFVRQNDGDGPYTTNEWKEDLMT